MSRVSRRGECCGRPNKGVALFQEQLPALAGLRPMEYGNRFLDESQAVRQEGLLRILDVKMKVTFISL